MGSAPVQESDVEKAKQDLTVNVLRVMMVPPGVQKIFIYRSRGAGLSPSWSIDQAGHVVDTLYMNN